MRIILQRRTLKIPSETMILRFFYHTNESKEEGLNLYPAATLVNKDQTAIEVPKGMVIEKRLPYLLSLLESHAGTTAP